ncbi:MAG: TonB-dependent receptor [Cyclobacteriaceae bacterium]|nr:TonB-dependent receptor [Cyclobacteriaceae bacterium]
MTRYILICLMTLYVGAFAQGNKVSGTVKDTDGNGLPGVNVFVKNTTSGTSTDFDGNYTLNVGGSDTLVFSFIGYQTQELLVGNQSVIDVVLSDDVTQLEEIVVIGYGSQQKKDVSASVVVVGEDAIKDRPMVSAATALQGKAAGVQVVQPSGKPGGDISVRVRGTTSVSLRNDPLYVVDGIPMTDIKGINPQDIVSLTVMKDAASTAIYGLRGANGVVLITTKKGKEGEPLLQFGAYGGFSKLRKFIETLSTKQYRDLMEEINLSLDPTWTSYTDWNDKVFGTGYIQNYQLTFSGGTDKTRYLISANYLNDKGIVAPAQYGRYSVRANFDSQLKPWLKVGTNVNIISSKTEDTPDNLSSGRGGVIMSTLNTPPFLNVYKSDGSGQFDPNPFQPSWENPLAYMYGPDQQQIDNRLIANFTGEATIVKGLTFDTHFALDANTHQWDYYLDPFRTNYGRNNNGIGRADKSMYYTWTFENTLTYNREIGKHDFTVLGGTAAIKYKYNDSYMAGYDFPDDTSIKTLNAANVITDASTSIDEWSLLSYFGRVLYNYDSKYLFTASLRRDGSSKLADKWATSPSFSAGWRISSESFMQNIELIDDLKLRVGWGKTANQDGLPNNYLAYGQNRYARRTPTNPLSGPTVYQYSIGNPYLTWEITSQTNIGLDISLLKARLNLTVDAYLKTTKNLILDVDLPNSVGEVSNILTNGGSIENKGLELSISSVNIDKKLRWNTDFNISFNRNKVVDLTYTPVSYYGAIYSNNTSVSLFKVGEPLAVFYGYIADGVDPNTGDMIYRDINDNGYWDPGDRTIIGDPNPVFIGGITNTLSYKNWNLSVFFQGSYGNDIFNSTRIDLEGMFDSKNQSVAVLDRWTPENTNTDIPRAVGGGDVYNVQNSTRFVEDGSYLRLKAITLTYNFNPDWVKKVGIHKLSVYSTGENLLTFTKYSGFDPEVNAYGNSPLELGIDYGTYPQTTTVTFGVNVEF